MHKHLTEEYLLSKLKIFLISKVFTEKRYKILFGDEEKVKEEISADLLDFLYYAKEVRIPRRIKNASPKIK
jgi:hypothetical protein